jgi:AmmeMemoRadiSam system protein B
LIPVVLGPCDPEEMAQRYLALAAGSRTLLVVSADLSHYLPYANAVHTGSGDAGPNSRLWTRTGRADQVNRTCGRYPVGVLLELARKGRWRPVLLHYSNSGDTAGDKSAVVGYGAVAFYGEEPMHKSN